MKRRRGGCGGWLATGAFLGAALALWLAAGAPFHVGDWIDWLLSSDPSTAVTVTDQGGVLELEGLKVEFGPEALPAGTVVRARRLARAEERYPRDGPLRLAGPIYAVEPPPGLPLGATVQVTLPYDPAKLPNPQETSGLVGALWDGRAWDRRPATVDVASQTLSFVADHFSVIAPLVEAEGDSLSISTPRFHIRWHAGAGPEEWKPLSGARYVSPRGTADGSVPAYINDLGEYLDEAYGRIQEMGYTMPPTDSPIEVVVQDLNPYGVADLFSEYVLQTPKGYGVYGQTSVWGPIYIDTRLRNPDGGLLPAKEVPERLKTVAGHELFHVVQRYHPSFPTWFYEAGAVFMEWRLYGQEFPHNLPQIVQAHPQFLYEGMWAGSVGAHYAKAAFLVYLQEQYGRDCGGRDRDVLKDGVFASGFGGSSYLHAAANQRQPDLSQALLAAARLCGGFGGTWDDLLAEFARDYLMEWDDWPTGSALLGGNHDLPLVHAARGNAPDAREFTWRTFTDPGGSKAFDLFSWREASAAMWRVEGASDLLATLVLQMAPAAFDWQTLPVYWAYSFLNVRDREPAIGPKQFVESNPTIAVPRFGLARQEGARVERVFLMGVLGKAAYSALQGGFGNSALTAYLLPAPQRVETKEVQVAEAGRTVPKLRVSWAVNPKWLPTEIKGLYHVVGSYSGNPDDPLRSSFGGVPVEKGNSLDIEPPPPGTRIAVVLVDHYGNQGPAAVADPPAMAGPKGLEDVVIAAVERLGYGWRKRSQGTEQPEAGAAGLVSCSNTTCFFEFLLSAPDIAKAVPGRVEAMWLQVFPSRETAQRSFETSYSDLHEQTHRGLKARVRVRDFGYKEQGYQTDVGLDWESRRSIFVLADTIIASAGRTGQCISVVDWPRVRCGPLEPVGDVPAHMIDALLEEAEAGGLIPPGTLR